MQQSLSAEQDDEKIYYTIGEVAEKFGVNTSLIRFWEKEFEVLQPKKNKKGNRLFTREDMHHLRLIFHLVKERGYTLEGARKKLKENRNDLEQQVQLRDSLVKIRGFLENLKAGL
jgi:DNA-binding transcriptional MerR regulator